jgi:uncharacterized protein YcbX
MKGLNRWTVRVWFAGRWSDVKNAKEDKRSVVYGWDKQLVATDAENAREIQEQFVAEGHTATIHYTP